MWAAFTLEVMRTVLHLCDLSPKTHKPRLIVRKISDESPFGDSLRNTQRVFLQVDKVIKQKCEKLSQERGAEEM